LQTGQKNFFLPEKGIPETLAWRASPGCQIMVKKFFFIFFANVLTGRQGRVILNLQDRQGARRTLTTEGPQAKQGPARIVKNSRSFPKRGFLRYRPRLNWKGEIERGAGKADRGQQDRQRERQIGK